MSFPDDPFSEDELFGQCLIETLEELEKRSVASEAEDGPAMPVLSPSTRSRIAHLVANAITSGNLDGYKDCVMGGVQLYDTRKISRGVKAALDEVLEDVEEVGDCSTHARVTVDVASTRGVRRQMEDKHVAIHDLNALTAQRNKEPQSYFGVYDGHGGVEVAKYVQAQLHLNIVNQPNYHTDTKDAIFNGFMQTDKNLLVKADRDAITSGSTAVVALVKGRKLYVAWCGDSQACMCKAGQPVALMNPHKPEREDEKQRITDAGGIVVWYGAWRVNAVLSVSRAFGDAKLKKYVICDPDITEHDLDDECEYMVIACDGLWDVMGREAVVEFVNKWLGEHDGVLAGVSESMAQHAVKDLGSGDNISVLVVSFNDLSSDLWTTPVPGVSLGDEDDDDEDDDAADKANDASQADAPAESAQGETEASDAN